MADGHSMLRKGRSAMVVRVHLLTFATAHGAAHFSGWPVAADAARCLASAATWTDARLLAWVLMPDHWHGLVQLDPATDLPKAASEARARVARHLHQAHPQLGRIWAPGFHETALRRENDLLRAAHHLLMNPVRAGLVQRLRDYPYWDAAWL